MRKNNGIINRFDRVDIDNQSSVMITPKEQAILGDVLHSLFNIWPEYLSKPKGLVIVDCDDADRGLSFVAWYTNYNAVTVKIVNGEFKASIYTDSILEEANLPEFKGYRTLSWS